MSIQPRLTAARLTDLSLESSNPKDADLFKDEDWNKSDPNDFAWPAPPNYNVGTADDDDDDLPPYQTPAPEPYQTYYYEWLHSDGDKQIRQFEHIEDINEVADQMTAAFKIHAESTEIDSLARKALKWLEDELRESGAGRHI